MADNAEQIESKLASYVDGELSGEQRKEIEAHLEANPTHRALIADLVRHRTMVRALPREAAPRDLNDDVTGGLERESLLAPADADDRSGVLFRIYRSPSWLSAAAIVVLGLGLGALVYFILPPKHPIAIVSSAGKEFDGDALGEDETEELDAVADASKLGAARPSEEIEVYGKLAMKAGPAGGAMPEGNDALVQANSAVLAGGGGFGAGGGADSASAQLGELAQVVNLNAEEAARTVILTVSADDVPRANRDVVAYLATNGIAYSTAVVPFGAPGGAGDAPAQLNNVDFFARGGAAAGAGGGAPQSVAPTASTIDLAPMAKQSAPAAEPIAGQKRDEDAAAVALREKQMAEPAEAKKNEVSTDPSPLATTGALPTRGGTSATDESRSVASKPLAEQVAIAPERGDLSAASRERRAMSVQPTETTLERSQVSLSPTTRPTDFSQTTLSDAKAQDGQLQVAQAQAPALPGSSATGELARGISQQAGRASEAEAPAPAAMPLGTVANRQLNEVAEAGRADAGRGLNQVYRQTGNQDYGQARVANSAGAQVILARNLNRSQVTALSEALSRPEQNQRAALGQTVSYSERGGAESNRAYSPTGPAANDRLSSDPRGVSNFAVPATAPAYGMRQSQADAAQVPADFTAQAAEADRAARYSVQNSLRVEPAKDGVGIQLVPANGLEAFNCVIVVRENILGQRQMTIQPATQNVLPFQEPAAR